MNPLPGLPLNDLPSPLFLGVGNRMMADDGAGPLVIDRLSGHINAPCIDAGDVPENFVEKIARLKPATLVIIDAVWFDGAPGDVRVFGEGDIAWQGLSTHAMSLSLCCEYVKNRVPIRIFLIGIRPERAQLGQTMGPAVERAVSAVAETLITLAGLRAV